MPKPPTPLQELIARREPLPYRPPYWDSKKYGTPYGDFNRKPSPQVAYGKPSMPDEVMGGPRRNAPARPSSAPKLRPRPAPPGGYAQPPQQPYLRDGRPQSAGRRRPVSAAAPPPYAVAPPPPPRADPPYQQLVPIGDRLTARDAPALLRLQ